MRKIQNSILLSLIALLLSGCSIELHESGIGQNTSPPPEPAVLQSVASLPPVAPSSPDASASTLTAPDTKAPAIPLTVEEAEILAGNLWAKYATVRSYYANSGLPAHYDAEPLMTGNIEYYPVFGEVVSIAALKSDTEAVITMSFAEEYYAYAFEGDNPLYIERDGQLYMSDPGGIGWPEEWHFNILEIREQTEDTLVVAAERYVFTTEETSMKEITFKKTAGGWRIDSIEY